MKPAIACALLAAACGGDDIDATLRFADRTDDELMRLRSAARGNWMTYAAARIDRFGVTASGDPCPTVSASGTTVTVTGGCTRLDGVRVQGSATVDNPFGWDQLTGYDPARDTVYHADQLVLTMDDGPQTFDGTIRRSDELRSWDADITVTISGTTIRSALEYACTGPDSWPSCEHGSSALEMPGVGGAHVTGSVAPDAMDRAISSYTLEGADTLTMSSVGGLCWTWSISGTDRGGDCP